MIGPPLFGSHPVAGEGLGQARPSPRARGSTAGCASPGVRDGLREEVADEPRELLATLRARRAPSRPAAPPTPARTRPAGRRGRGCARRRSSARGRRAPPVRWPRRLSQIEAKADVLEAGPQLDDLAPHPLRIAALDEDAGDQLRYPQHLGLAHPEPR